MRDRYRRLDDDAFDAIVVGAGTGGLVAAALLATRGKKVLVVDQHYVAGGNATTFRRKRFEFDIGIHYVGDCGRGGLVPRILKAAGAENVAWEEMDADGIDTFVFPDFRFRFPKGIERYRERLLAQFPAEQRGIERYLDLVGQALALSAAGARPMRALAALPRSWQLVRWASQPFARFLDTCTANPQLRAVMAAHHGIYAQPPSRVPTLLAAGITAHYLTGGYMPRGGGQVTSDALAESIEGHGGTILLKARVERIIVEDGAVRGIELVSKHLGRRTVRAPIVVSNADLKQTVSRLVGAEHLSAKTVDRTAAYEMSPALGIVYLGIARDLKAEGHPATNYHLFPSYDHEAGYARVRRGEFTDTPWVYVTIASLKDPTNMRLAPPGMTNLQIMAVVPSDPAAWGVSADDARDGTYRQRPAYRARKEAFARSLIDAAETVLPGLRDAIVYQEVATPFTQSRYTLSSGGTSYGIACTTEQFFGRRPGARTEIAGLYLCGASTRTVHGIPGVAMGGLMAASEVLGPRLLWEVLGPGRRRTSRLRALEDAVRGVAGRLLPATLRPSQSP
jgi:all-trans-retinol 13,14-reductase